MPKKRTMKDFWVQMGWYKEVYDRATGTRVRRFTYAKWKDDEQTQHDAVRFLVEEVLQKDPRDVTERDFYENRLTGLLRYYGDSPYEALREAGLVDKSQEAYMRSHARGKKIVETIFVMPERF